MRALAAVALFAAAAPARARLGGAGPCAALVTLDSGVANGTCGDSVRVWRSLPYAAPPTGTLRWAPPQPVAPWQGVKDARQNPPQCPQSGGGAEECLFVNAFIPTSAVPSFAASDEPALASGLLLPTLVWIHGGAFVAGGIADWQYDGSTLAAQQDLCVFTIQYRLGALGFLYLNATGSSIAGNFGLLDQQLAFKWVQANAAAFGCDSQRVAIAGQSAGGMSVAAHLAMPSSAGLYQRAIVQSDPVAFPYRPPAAAADLGATFAGFANCTGPQVEACLRALPVDAVMAAQQATVGDVLEPLASKVLYAAVPFAPVTGTDVLPQAPGDAFRNASAYVADVPTIMGTVRDEMDGLLYDQIGFNLTKWEYDLALAVIFGGADAQSIAAQYPPPANLSDFRQQICDVGTPAVFRCASRNATLALAARPGRTSAVYRYAWQHVSSFASLYWGPSDAQCWDRVCHSAEVAYLFQTNPAWDAGYSAAEAQLAGAMKSYWAAFAATGAPGSGSAAAPLAWPAAVADGQSSQTLLFNTPASVAPGAAFDAAECDEWDARGYSWY